MSSRYLTPRRLRRLTFVICLFLAIAVVALLNWRHLPFAEEADNESVMMAAAQVTQFSGAMRTAVGRMSQEGIAAAEIDFNREGASSHSLFYSRGGGVAYQRPPALCGKEEWAFHELKPGIRLSVDGIGTPASEYGHDLLVTLSGVPAAICHEINARLGFGPAPAVETPAVNLKSPGGVRIFRANKGILPGGKTPTAACVQNGVNGPYVFYRVLSDG